MAIKNIRNLTIQKESNTIWYHFKAEIDEDLGNWKYMKMQKGGDNSNDVIYLLDNSTYCTGDNGLAVWNKVKDVAMSAGKEWIEILL